MTDMDEKAKSLCRHPDHKVEVYYDGDKRKVRFVCECGREVRPTRWVVVRK
jgi:hypothetical protein